MNPLLLLVGLLGWGALSSSSRSTSGSNDFSEGKVPVFDPNADHKIDKDALPPEKGTEGGDDGGMDMGGGDGSMDMGGHSGHDVDLGTPSIAPPGMGASRAEINSYLNALAAAPETHVHGVDDGRMAEHDALMVLVPRGAATHTAIASGVWDDPNIWSNGEVPGDNARVLIPEGVKVDYSMVSDARLFTVRVDGALDFSTDQNSQMIFDTVVVSSTGHLIIGTADNPVDADVDIDLIVANNGRIDTNWDPMLLSRGLISHGDVTVHGAVKDSHEKVVEDPMAGDTSIRFAEAPEGWQVGDTIVIAGTDFDGYRWNNDVRARTFYESEDEVRVISAIEGNRVFFDDPLEFDHDAPRDDLATSVANYTRNVSIESESGADGAVFERGHVMFMHSDEVDVRYMEFTELGRTDKSEESQAASDIADMRFDSNVQGRYSLHLHRTGVDDPENPTILEGNAVYGSPGWGIVHHDSNAIISNNATFDTFGAGYVAETGNETGIWSDNIAILAEGIGWDSPKNTSEINGPFDVARGGHGFWFQGRMVAAVDNVAANVNTGFVYFHRDSTDTMIDFDASLYDIPDALYNADQVTADDVPIMIFEGNETFAAREGLHVVKQNPNQGHDIWSRLDNFTAWSVLNGVELEYTSHYILSNFDLTAREPERFAEPQDGITFGNNLTEIVVIDSRIDGFSTGIDLNGTLTAGRTMDDHGYFVINTEIINVDRQFINRDPNDTVLNNAPSSNYHVDLNVIMRVLDSDGISITGTKTDGLGTTNFPGGMDTFTIGRSEVAGILDTTGYWTTSSGQAYTLIDVYFTDRLTGDIYYETQRVDLDGLPYGNGWVSNGLWANNINNGVQDVVMRDGQLMAGDTVIGQPVAVASPTIQTMSPSIDALNAPATYSATMPSMPDHDHSGHAIDGDSVEMQMMSAEATAAQTWINGYEGDDPLSLFVSDGFFGNDGDVSNLDLIASGGETVLATGGGSYEVSASRTLAVFEAAAEIGFDGTDGDIALLELKEGSTLVFAANDGDLGLIEEFDSSGFEGPTDVRSGVGLDGTLAIDLSNLSEESGSQFTLISADEITGLFDDTTFNGLGARDARVVVDYENDSVTLDLTEGTGDVSVETVGVESDVTSGYEALWTALTASQGVVSDAPPSAEDDGEFLDDAA